MHKIKQTGNYFKIDFLTIDGMEHSIEVDGQTRTREITGVDTNLKNEEQVMSTIITFFNWLKDQKLEFETVSGVLEDIYLDTKQVLNDSNIKKVSSLEEARALAQQIMLDSSGEK